MSEFSLIEDIRRSTLSARADVALGIGDDAAVLALPDGCRLVACTDTLVAGVHFPPATAAVDIGWKSLAVNLSDLAAMGAQPAWALLALTLPTDDRDFVDGFAAGFADLARAQGVALVGGDTTRGPLSITVTALGTLPPGAALSRGGARAGDAVFVTGTLGDAAGALAVRVHAQGAPEEAPAALRARLDRPEPRVAAGLALRGVASACIDVSDGLVADLGHLCTASGAGAEIRFEALPVSTELAARYSPQAARMLALAGGDDYELCFTAPPGSAAVVREALARSGCAVTMIGRIVAGSGVQVLDHAGDPIEVPRTGWEHFAP